MIGRLHVLVDSFELAQQVVAGGADCIQIRVKDADDATRLAVTNEITNHCRDSNVQCIVNDRADLAVAAGAMGVHLGARDLPIPVVRKLFGDELVIGGTARNSEVARALQAHSASYLGVGPVYPTSSKTGLPDPIGIEVLQSVVRSVNIPVIAISGITLDHLPEVLATGVHGVAVIAAITQAQDPTLATKEFLRVLEDHYE